MTARERSDQGEGVRELVTVVQGRWMALLHGYDPRPRVSGCVCRGRQEAPGWDLECSVEKDGPSRGDGVVDLHATSIPGNCCPRQAGSVNAAEARVVATQ